MTLVPDEIYESNCDALVQAMPRLARLVSDGYLDLGPRSDHSFAFIIMCKLLFASEETYFNPLMRLWRLQQDGDASITEEVLEKAKKVSDSVWFGRVRATLPEIIRTICIEINNENGGSNHA